MKMNFFILLASITTLLICPEFLSAGTNFQIADGKNFAVAVEAGSVQRTITQKDAAGIFSAHARLDKYLLVLGYTPLPGLSLYLKPGLVWLEIPEYDDFLSRADPVYEAGFSAYLYPLTKKGLVFLSGDFTYFKSSQTHNTDIGLENEEIRWQEYQVTLGIDYSLQMVSPYAGLRYSIVDGTDKLSVSGDLDISQEESVGIVFGVRAGTDYTIDIGYSLFDKNEFSIKVGVEF